MTGAAVAAFSLVIFCLSSMAGPHQLDYLAITIVCDVVLVMLVSF